MFKVIFIAALLGILVFFIIRRLGFAGGSASAYLPASEWMEIRMDNTTLKRVVRQTLFSVMIGFVLLTVVLVIAAKFKIALLVLPVSIYLIGQYFILLNQLKAVRRQQIFYNRISHRVKAQSKGREDIIFDLTGDALRLREVRAVQKNNGLLLGYYELKSPKDKLLIPYVLEENTQNKPFFDALRQFPREVESRLFPVISHFSGSGW